MTRFARSADGLAIAYEVLGEGPPIVLIHGFAAHRGITWRSTGWYDSLTRAGRQVIALDCRGHGGSDKPRDPTAYDDRLMLGDVLAVLDALEVPCADVMGYSMGGYMTVNLMHEAPERVRRAIVAGVGEHYFSFWKGRNETIAAGLDAADDSAVRDALAHEFRRFALRAKGDLPALAACMRRRRLAFTRQELADIVHPVLVVCGADDPIAGAPEPLAELFAHGLAVRVADRNHHSTVGDPAYKRAVTDFLAG